MQNIESGKYIFFALYDNFSLLDKPHYITNEHSLQKCIDTFKKLDPLTYIQNQRPDNKRKRHVITNVVYNVLKTNYPMDELPDFILKKHCVVRMHIHLYKCKKEYKDNLCSFRCMA